MRGSILLMIFKNHIFLDDKIISSAFVNCRKELMTFSLKEEILKNSTAILKTFCWFLLFTRGKTSIWKKIYTATTAPYLSYIYFSTELKLLPTSIYVDLLGKFIKLFLQK